MLDSAPSAPACEPLPSPGLERGLDNTALDNGAARKNLKKMPVGFFQQTLPATKLETREQTKKTYDENLL